MLCAGSALSELAERLRWRRFWRDQRGVSATEYGLMIAGFVCVIIVALTLMGNATGQRFNYIANVVQAS